MNNTHTCNTRLFYIYTPVALPEKIFQRQRAKSSLSDAVVDDRRDARHTFSREDLRDLFTLTPETLSETHDRMHCDCAPAAAATTAAAKSHLVQSTLAEKRMTKQQQQQDSSALRAYSHHWVAASVPVCVVCYALLLPAASVDILIGFVPHLYCHVRACVFVCLCVYLCVYVYSGSRLCK